MTSRAFKATTAIFTALSLVQPLPALAQDRPGANAGGNRASNGRDNAASGSDARSFEAICSEAGIAFGPDCRVHIQTLQAADRAAAQAPARPAANARENRAPNGRGDSGVRAAAPSLEQVCVDAGISLGPDCRVHVEGLQAAARANAIAATEAAARDAARIEAATQAATQAEITTETVTERSRRSSNEEFRDWSRDDGQDRNERNASERSNAVAAPSGNGLSDLEKAGLLALGAVVVGAILSNGQRVESNTGDRVVVVDDNGAYQVLKDDDALLREAGADLRTERFGDGSTRSTITRDDGTRIVTIRDADGRAVRRVSIDRDGREHLLIDDTRAFAPVVVRDLPRPVYDDFDYRAATDRESLRQALLAADRRDVGRSFSLRQVREIAEVRNLAPEIDLGAITFATDSAALQPSQAEQLREMGLLMRDLVADDPTELLLIEGHTDAVGEAGYNLLLSDRRAESVALAFSEYFGVPAENMVVQGYGERFLEVPTGNAERANRRVAVRRITALMR